MDHGEVGVRNMVGILGVWVEDEARVEHSERDDEVREGRGRDQEVGYA